MFTLEKYNTRWYSHIRKVFMQYLKNNSFQRDLKSAGLDDVAIKTTLDDIFKERSISLGSKLYKIRGAKKGSGKSGGFRSLFFWKKYAFIIFCALFTKNERDNLNDEEMNALKILSKEYDNLSEEDIKKQIERKTLMEITYEKS